MTLTELATAPAATQGSVTLNWDAVCALNATQLSNFCFAQYVQAGPTTPASRLRVTVPDATSTYWLLDLTLGPPRVSFPTAPDPADGPQCVLTLEVLRGTVVSFDGNTAQILSSVQLQPNQNLLTGTVNLAKVDGTEDTVGHVTLDLGSGGYSATIEGIEPNSTLAANITTAIQTYFRSYGASYVLGTLARSSTTPACLQPVHFDLYSQPAPDGSGDGCVLVFIQTNSSGTPMPGPLTPYPIADDYTASLLISNQVIFNQLFPDGTLAGSLQAQFHPFGTIFSGVQNNGVYATVGNKGNVSLGQISGLADDTGDFILSVTNGDSSPSSNPDAKVVVPMNNFTLSPGGTTLAVNWTQVNTQWWASMPPSKFPSYQTESGAGTTTWTQQASPAVDSANNISFTTKNLNVSYVPQQYSWWDDFIGYFDLSGEMALQIINNLKSVLSGYQVPSVSTFSLLNLLFPAAHLITLTQAAIPCDLVAVGHVNAPLAVAPAQPTAVGGATQQFSASGGSGQYSWQLGPGSAGSLDANGLYTAPATLKQVAVDTILVTDSKDGQLNGYALVTLLPPSSNNGLLASPAAATLSANQLLALTALSPTSPYAEVEVTWTLPAAAVGKIVQSGMGGGWSYAAPAELPGGAPTTVVLTGTAVANPQLTCTATVTLQNSEAVTVTPSATSVAPKGTITLTATAAAGDLRGFSWLLYPVGQGTIEPTPGNSSQATYTAPATLPAGTDVTTVLAYGTGGNSNGLGLTNIKLTSS